jgi:long-chain acyl-CoA synthetase
VALVAPAEIGFKTLAQGIGISGELEQLCVNREVIQAATKGLHEHAKKCSLAKFEVPTLIYLCPELWTPESGLVTAAFKIKRREIHEKYRSELNRMYT